MSMTLKKMTPAECLEMLEGAHYGHLACSSDGQPYVVPIYFAFKARVAYSFSMPGRKVEWMRRNPKVCLQIEDWPAKASWRSVVLNGSFQELPDDDTWHEERIHAWSLLEKRLNWWEMGSLTPDAVPLAYASPHLFYCIFMDEVSGRIAAQTDQLA